jgi:hypothetical protein
MANIIGQVEKDGFTARCTRTPRGDSPLIFSTRRNEMGTVKTAPVDYSPCCKHTLAALIRLGVVE